VPNFEREKELKIKEALTYCRLRFPVILLSSYYGRKGSSSGRKTGCLFERRYYLLEKLRKYWLIAEGVKADEPVREASIKCLGE